MNAEIERIVERLLREQPRNQTVLALAAAVKERSLTLDKNQFNKFDRKTYMRDYMRKRRAGIKSEPQPYLP